MQPVTRIFRVGNVDTDVMFSFLRAHPEEMSLPERWQGGAGYVAKDLEHDSVVMDAFPTLVGEGQASGELTVQRDRLGIETGPVAGVVTINATRVHGIDGTDPDALSRAEVKTSARCSRSSGSFGVECPASPMPDCSALHTRSGCGRLGTSWGTMS